MVQSYGSFLSRQGNNADALKVFATFDEALPRHPLIVEATKLDLRIGVERRIQQHPFIGFVGELRLLHRLVEVAERQQGERTRGREISESCR